MVPRRRGKVNTREARQIVLAICRTLQSATLPVSVAIEDLRLAMLDADAEEAFLEILQAWAELTVGIQREGDKFTITPPKPDPPPAPERWPGLTARQRYAMEIATTHGQVVNADVREAFNISDEMVRLDLASLCREGLLAAEGEKRSRRYIPIPA